MSITYDSGASTFTNDYSTHYALVNKIAKQVILGVSSSNKLDWIDKGRIENGTTIEEAMVRLASGYDWVSDSQTGANLNAPSYPTIDVKYFKTWNGRQFKTTVSEDQIRKILLSGGNEGDIAQKVVSSLTEGENYEDYETCKGLLGRGIYDGNIRRYGTADVTIGKDLIKAIQDLVNAFQYVSKDYTGVGVVDPSYKTRTPFERIRLIMPYTIYNQLNVDVLASIFNLEKAKLLDRITLLDTTDGNVYVVDEFGLLKFTRLYKMTSKYVEDGLYSNYWLTVDRMYGSCGLFKMAYITTAQPTNDTDSE